jgi:hypothetical protein
VKRGAAVLVVLLLGVAPAGAAPRAPTAAPAIRPAVPGAGGAKSGGASNCAACHNESSWSDARFDHDRTGYPLRDAHTKVACAACHRRDFKTPVSQLCSGCHRDRHAGEFGLHCEGCHNEVRWAETLFGPDAHRTTSFPLTGKHAVIPCRECHGDMRDRTFSQTALACFACHRQDYFNAGLTSLNHVASNLSTDCRGCHNTWSWFPARFDVHDRCFVLSAGPHAPIRCAQCHTHGSVGLVVTGVCKTNSTTCTSCHDHNCARSDQEHPSSLVQGYSCTDTKCKECHLNAPP